MKKNLNFKSLTYFNNNFKKEFFTIDESVENTEVRKKK